VVCLTVSWCVSLCRGVIHYVVVGLTVSWCVSLCHDVIHHVVVCLTTSWSVSLCHDVSYMVWLTVSWCVRMCRGVSHGVSHFVMISRSLAHCVVVCLTVSWCIVVCLTMSQVAVPHTIQWWQEVQGVHWDVPSVVWPASYCGAARFLHWGTWRGICCHSLPDRQWFVTTTK